MEYFIKILTTAINFAILVDFIVLALIYLFIFLPKWRTKSRGRFIINTIFYIYLAFVLYFTLMPIITSLPFIFDHPYKPMNLTPFIDVTYGRGDFLRQIILNIIMTVPFGFLLPLVSRKNSNFLRVFLLTFFLSFTIEILQPLIGNRHSDITDLITNLLGGIIGYCLYLLFRPLITKFLHHLKPKPNPPSPNSDPSSSESQNT